MPDRETGPGAGVTLLLQTLFILIVALCVVSFSGCTSTGNDDNPVRWIGTHQLLYGHDKYTPAEKVEARCRYRNRHPNGTRAGFPKQCRREAVQFEAGINAAMYETMCVIDKCHKLAESWQLTQEEVR